MLKIFEKTTQYALYAEQTIGTRTNQITSVGNISPCVMSYHDIQMFELQLTNGVLIARQQTEQEVLPVLHRMTQWYPIKTTYSLSPKIKALFKKKTTQK